MSSIERYQPRSLSRANARQARYAVESARVSGIARAAKVEAAAFVAHAGLTHTALLSAIEGQLLSTVPLAEGRLRAVGDAYATLVAAELLSMIHD